MVNENFDLFVLPLSGIRLIEASAGTGKTYTLVVFYLRLLLGLGNQVKYSRPLKVEEILVVTFTKLAIEELRSRIREYIYRLRLACISGKSDDPLLAVFLTQLSDLKLAALHLLSAEQKIDEAAIYTIHGFCHRVLNYNSIKLGVLFHQTLLEDESCLQHQVSADFWRRYCCSLPLNIASIVQSQWNGPKNLLSELLPYLQGEMPALCNPPNITEPLLTQCNRIIDNIENIRQEWIAVSASLLEEILYKYRIDRRVYNRNNLSKWCKKIDLWAYGTTLNGSLPDELKRFKYSALKEKTISGESPKHSLFIAVETLYQNKLLLRECMFVTAIKEIRQALDQEKIKRAEIGYDDLLRYLDHALDSVNGESLAESIRACYPVAMIDEFQDTDPQQYRIFRRIYHNHLDSGLLLIGDPKQAIYAFRGADIFTYIQARNEIDSYHTLDTNWRSSPGMINATNQLFQNLITPFIFKEIPFYPVSSAKCNSNLRLVIRNQSIAALQIWLHPGDCVHFKEYQQCMAQQCASKICEWLHASHQGEAWLEGKQGCQLLQASDITVLVRNRDEAILIRDALSTLMIPSVYLSNYRSVFETQEAHELQRILQAVLTPNKATVLRSALATKLLGVDAANINELNKNELSLEKRMEEFYHYHQLWHKSSILPMLHEIMHNYHIVENLLSSPEGRRRLTDLLHLGELLQEASIQLTNKFSLLRWLKARIESPNPQEAKQQLRLESDRNFVKIITVHKSKGLEFPIVFLPFAANFRIQKKPLFHDRQTYQAWLDLRAKEESLKLAEEERLSEDLRIFYVALTRSVYHCSFGIAPLYHNKKANHSDFHLSAPGYLIQKGQKGNADNLRDHLTNLVKLACDDITLCSVLNSNTKAFSLDLYDVPILMDRSRYSIPNDPWRITSYSELKKYSISVKTEISSFLEEDKLDTCKMQKESKLTPHTFPRGTSTGRFFHNLFETLNFNFPLDISKLTAKLEQQDIDLIWLPMVADWIKNIITTPLDGKKLTLTHLLSDNSYTEFPFYLSIDSIVKVSDMEILCKRYDPLSSRCPALNFSQIQGILKGFIDLVFRWHGRYYLLDYKSNWLGKNSDAYNLAMIKKTMISHRYELQYQLYTLALHRFLRQRLKDYSYQHHFGGVYYLFLRGINILKPKNGIFYCRPDIALIDGLDSLFRGG